MSQNSKFIHKSHNVTILLYHLVSSAKYRRVVISDSVDRVLVETCAEIEKRYEVFFLEVGTDKDHVHFLIQSVPSYSVTTVSYTHLRAHETVLDLVCRLLLEKKKQK